MLISLAAGSAGTTWKGVIAFIADASLVRDLLAHDRGSGPAQSTIDSSISASVQHRVRTQAAPLCERSVGLTPPLSGRCCTPKRQNARFGRTNARGLPAPGATSPH